MNSKQQATLKNIFEGPVKSNINWSDAEARLKAFGSVTEGNGSRIRAFVNGKGATFHRGHPEKETDKGIVKSVRGSLKEAGVMP